MTDFYDMAKPVRDAALAELERSKRADLEQHQLDAMALALHLTGIVAAWGIDRHKTTHGQVSDPHLQDVVASAFGQAIANAATSFRPSRNGKPIGPCEHLTLLMPGILREAYRMATSFELGLSDFIVSIDRAEDGTLSAREGDVMAMLRGMKR